MLQKSQVVLDKHSDVRDAREIHRQSIKAESKRKAGDNLRVESTIPSLAADLLEYRRVDHAAAGQLQPLATEHLGMDVNLVAWFGKRKKVRTEAHFGFRTEKLSKEIFQRALQVGDRDIAVDDETLHLRELGEVRCIHLIAAIRGARSDHAHWRRLRFHDAYLHRRGMRSQETPIGKVKGIQLVARGMIWWSIERIETIPFSLNVRSIGQGKPEPAKYLYSLGQASV